MFAQHLRHLWAQVQHRAAMEFPPGLTPNEAALLVAGVLPDFWATTNKSAAPATYKRACVRFRVLCERQMQHIGPHPLTPLIEDALLPFIT